jgi:DNA-binding transcriptional LysR family regulator
MQIVDSLYGPHRSELYERFGRCGGGGPTDAHSRSRGRNRWKAVEQGLGIGYVADFEFVAHPKLKTVRIRDAKIQTKYYLAFLTERRDARLVKAFRDVALRVKKRE